MPIHLRRSPRPGAWLTALPWLAAAAWLTVASPAAGQQNDFARPPRSSADAGGRVPVDEWARLSNDAEMEREIAARYPQARGDRQVAGVLLRFRILGDGRVDSTSISVVQTWNAASPALGVEVARRLRFVPATANGHPLATWIEFPVHYTLPDGSGVAQGTIDRQPGLQNQAEVARRIGLHHPPTLRDRGIAGSVLLRLKVTSEGTVDSASISMQQATDTAFIQPAMLVARRMRFIPAMAHGQPAQTWITVPVHFTIPALRYVPPDEGTYELAAVEEEPRLLNRREIAHQLAAQYPPALRDSLVAGDVTVRFTILENGTVHAPSISVMMATHAAFGEAARNLVAGMRFAPANLGGRPVRVWVTIPIHFGFEGAPPARSDSTRAGAATPPAGTRS